jgi:hypothetical protein
MAADMMTSFGVRSAGLSGMLFVFLLGRVVIDAAEKSVISERKNKTGYVPDSDDSDLDDSDSE